MLTVRQIDELMETAQNEIRKELSKGKDSDIETLARFLNLLVHLKDCKIEILEKRRAS